MSSEKKILSIFITMIKSNQKFILLLITNIWFLFISIVCLHCAFSVEEQWIAIIDIICFSLNFGLFIISLYEILKYKKQNKTIENKEVIDYFPLDFFNTVLAYFIYNKGSFKYEDKDWIVNGYYFVKEDLYLEVIAKNEMFKDNIMIDSKGNCKFMINYNKCKESKLSKEAISKVVQLKKLDN